ncbi:uncharacterized protein LOC117645461 [Thrips palmi]|uniref:Gustatory receptor n=1 Tax=Thrips palmi TaxID=161013 RepID=A0A6P8YWC4_THRPL|nr:uncharacterized protein LOC117645461 [Thrips palmi]
MAMRNKIRHEFDKLSMMALEAQKESSPPTPPLPRVASSRKVDPLRLMVYVTRMLGVSPVTVGPPSAGGRSTYLQSRAWMVYSLALIMTSVLTNGHRGFTFLVDVNSRTVTSAVVGVLFSVTFLTSVVSSLFCLVGTVRKYRLLHTILSWPTPANGPSGTVLALQIAASIAAYGVTDIPIVLMFPPIIMATQLVLLVWLVINMVDRFTLAHLLKLVGHSFAAVNGELQQLATLVRERPQKYLPDASAKVAVLRDAHDKAQDQLDHITKAFELQMVGILLNDFTNAVMVVYLTVQKVSGNSTGSESFSDRLLINSTYSFAATVVACMASSWTSQQGSETQTYVHRVLRSPFVSEAETQEGTVKPFPTNFKELADIPHYQKRFFWALTDVPGNPKRWFYTGMCSQGWTGF